MEDNEQADLWMDFTPNEVLPQSLCVSLTL